MFVTVAEPSPDHELGVSAGIALGRAHDIYSERRRLVERGEGSVVVEAAPDQFRFPSDTAECPATENNLRDLDTRLAQEPFSHVNLRFRSIPSRRPVWGSRGPICVGRRHREP